MSEAAEAAALAHLIDCEDDLHSDDLDRLEEEAEQELLADMEREGLDTTTPPESAEDAQDEADDSYEYGPLSREDVHEILADLRKHGMMECLRRHILPAPSKVRRMHLPDRYPASLARCYAGTCERSYASHARCWTWPSRSRMPFFLCSKWY